MGSGLSWLEGEDLHSANAFLAVRQRVIPGTDKMFDNLWEKTMEDVRALREAAGVNWATHGRTLSSLQHHWTLASQGIHDFANAYRRVKDAQPTGNVSEEELISRAIASTVSKELYKSMREDRAKDEKECPTRERAEKTMIFEFVGCLRILRHQDQFSGVAAASARRARAIGTWPPTRGRSTSASGSASGRAGPHARRAQAGGSGGDTARGDGQTLPEEIKYQPAQLGVKAAKAVRFDVLAQVKKDADDAAEKRATSRPLVDMAKASKSRSGTTFFLHPVMLSTKAAIRIRRLQTAYYLGDNYIELDSSSGSSSDSLADSGARSQGQVRRRVEDAGTGRAGGPSGAPPSPFIAPQSPRVQHFERDAVDGGSESRLSVTRQGMRESIARARRPMPDKTPTTSDEDLV